MKQKDVYLVPFPFSNFKRHKIRPVVIISNNTFNTKNKDVLVSGITSKKRDECITITNTNMKEGNLLSTSYIKAENILKIQKTHLHKKLGEINEETFQKVKKKIIALF